MHIPQNPVAAEKTQFILALDAAKAFDPTISALLTTELNWRLQTRVDNKTVDSARVLVQAVIDLAKRVGWEPA